MTQAQVEASKDRTKDYAATVDTLLAAITAENRQPTQAERQAARDALDALIEAGDDMLA